MDAVNLPSLDRTIHIPQKLIEDFRINGHTLTPGIISPEELAPYQKAISAAVKEYNTEKRKIEERDTYGKAFLQIMNL